MPAVGSLEINETWCSADWAGVEPSSFKPYLGPRTPTIEDRIKEAEIRLSSLSACQRLVREQISLYVIAERHPSILDRDLRYFSQAALHWGRKLGGLRTAKLRRDSR